MRCRVELRRSQGGVWIARFRKQAADLVGQLATGRQEVGGRSTFFLHLTQMEALSGIPRESPVLFEPRLTEALEHELRFLGYEKAAEPGKGYFLQEWDVFPLPDRPSR